MIAFPEHSLLSKEDRETIEVIRPHFDASFYVSNYPETESWGIEPLIHYTLYGWRMGLDPTPDFSTLGYLTHNPDVADARLNPFWHFHMYGKNEGRVSRTHSATSPPGSDGANERVKEEIAALREAFDTEFYLEQNPDLANAGIDPLEHFVVHGWKEGRDPNADFSTRGYLSHNPDVAEAGLNPFWHYVVAGKREGRTFRHPGGYRAEILISTSPLEEEVKARTARFSPKVTLSAAQLFEQIRERAGAVGNALLLSIGHDNYRHVPGGVQHCIQQEEKIALERNHVYLNLHPFVPLPCLALETETPDVPITLVLDGSTIGTAPLSAVIDAISRLTGTFESIEVAIHHLLGHSPEQIARLVRASGNTHCWFWLHDFFTLCPSSALQRNNVSFCGAPPQTSNACRLCMYGDERLVHTDRIAAFFDSLSVRVIAPSDFVARYWKQRTNLKYASLRICEHLKLDWSKRQHEIARPEGPVKLAFVGIPAPHKGWPVFEKVVSRIAPEKAQYQFVYFGSTPISLKQVKRVPVTVTAEDPDAMIRAIAEQDVDLVLHWANCAETFSFSTHEVFAAGAFVITNSISGNVAETVRRSGLGVVLDSESDLEAFFQDGRALSLAEESRTRRSAQQVRLIRSDMTLTVLDQENRP